MSVSRYSLAWLNFDKKQFSILLYYQFDDVCRKAICKIESFMKNNKTFQ